MSTVNINGTTLNSYHSWTAAAQRQFGTLPSEHPFWEKAIRQLPIPVRDDLPFKDQVKYYYEKVSTTFESKKSKSDLEVQNLKREMLSSMKIVRGLFHTQTERMASPWALKRATGASCIADRPLIAAHDLYSTDIAIQIEDAQVYRDKIGDQIVALQESFAQDPITKVFIHFALVLNGQADQSHLYNADWSKYFPEQKH